ncbi:MAG: tetratricopeptide repeat protein [candidate division WOR-3 bacterium]|nr:MAG: tetratricopeptide repeat protein [candidate division WOR-3 bacterium]
MTDRNTHGERIFQRFIADYCGIRCDTDKWNSLKEYVHARMNERGYSNYLEYCDFLKFHPDSSVDLKDLVSLMTVNETNFFRHPDQFTALKKYVLPALHVTKCRFHSANAIPLSVWSAGCATGDETYSIAIAILESGQSYIPEILGTDIDGKVLKEAMQGIYSKNSKSLRYIEKNHLERYFDQHGAKYRVKNAIRDTVTFDHHNLVSTPYPLPLIGKWDIIFCRNVFIYFETDTVRRVIRNMYEYLNDNGYLFIGYSESLFNISADFLPMQIGEIFVYRKLPTKTPEAFIPEITPAPKKKNDHRPRPVTKTEEKRSLFTAAFELFSRCEFDDSLEKILQFLKENPVHAEGRLLAGRIYLEKGLCDQAAREFTQLIQSDSLCAPAHYFLGVIHMKKNQFEQAIKQFKKALYANRNFAMAHFSLATAYQYSGVTDRALREYRNVIKCLQKNRDNELPECANGFNVKVLIETCRRSIQRLQETLLV